MKPSWKPSAPGGRIRRNKFGDCLPSRCDFGRVSVEVS